MRTHYDNLKVLETASRDDIKSSYRKLCLKHHPDRNPGNAEAERIMRIINDAYDVLSDPAKRRAYDQELVLRRATETPSRRPASRTRREAWPPQHEARRPYTRKPGQTYQGPPVRPSGGWYRQWSSGHQRTGSGGVDQLTMRVLICVAVVAFANIFFKNSSSLPFGPTTPAPGGNFLDSRPLHTHSAASPSFSPLPHPPETSPNTFAGRPAKAPNGSPWPENAGYIMGYPMVAVAGESRVTLDNTTNDDDVFAKLTSLKNGAQVRTFYVPAHAAFTLMSINPGDYDLRFRNLTTGRMYKTRALAMKEMGNGLSIEYTTFTVRLTRTGSENLESTEVTEQDF